MPDSATVQEGLGATLADRIRLTAQDRPDRPALLADDRIVTWADLDTAVDRTAAALARTVQPDPTRPPTGAGTAAGPAARVAIALGNGVDFVVAYFATLRAGLVAVPVNPDYTAPELRHVLADSGAKVLIGTAPVRELVAGLGAELPALARSLPAPPTAEPDTGAGGSPGGAGLDDLAVLLYTSGTTGRAKGAMLSHRALLANHEQLGRIEPPVLGPDDVVLLALPLFHAYGLNSALGAVVHHGACGVLVDRFEPAEGLALIARHRVSVLVGVPSMFAGWAAAGADRPASAGELAAVRLAVCGAAPLDPAVATRCAALFGTPVQIGYGLTETAPVLTSTLPVDRPKPGSIGRPIPGVEVRLVSAAGDEFWRAQGRATRASTDGAGPDGTGPGDDGPELDLPSAGTDPGQLVVRGDNLFAGYWPDGRDGPDPDGWWPTGDVGYADADGDLFLVDRLGELILVNGFNVYPREVELVLEAHPQVRESAAVAVPDPRTGQAVEAYVVRTPGSSLTADEVLAHCATSLARFKRPTRVRFVDTLPRSVIGKVRKTQLRSEYGDA
ncbi:AMP-binding protein [Solwaraspora sp. WMMD1047]|uniref:AMP-binding protein n=1 Tax=Solwaraspora sp. WMMD1047 TaxID=3016102 RepID=UPI002415A7E9|nr:AMP-binding protein [Solwaraspora sp. WMMD1047]MDG4833568.1 AMP-binding protein [Solwaraspora sp. WMMD1047]